MATPTEPTIPLYHQKLAQFPDMLKSVMLHDATDDFNLEIAEKFALTPTQVKSMASIIQLLLLKTLLPKDIPAKIETELLLDPKKAKELSLDLLGLRGLPLEWYLGPVQPVMRNLGGNPEVYLQRLRPLYPEVFSNGPLRHEPEPDPDDPMVELEAKYAAATAAPAAHDEILHNFDQRLSSFAGQAEVLLRLTGLGSEIEDAAKAGKIDQAEAEKKLADLDAMSSAINIRDLNPFEVQALHRRLARLLTDLQGKL